MLAARLLRAAALVAPLVLAAPSWADPPIVTVGTRSFAMKDDDVPPITLAKRKISWNVRSADDVPEHQFVLPVPGSAGDPTTAGASGGGAVLTVYNSAGSGESFTVLLPAANWHLQAGSGSSRRFLFVTDPATSPVSKVYLKDAKISVRGGKAPWGYTLDEPSQGSIAVRLTVGTETTYCTDLPPRYPSTQFDKTDRFFSAYRVPAPAVCPPLP